MDIACSYYIYCIVLYLAMDIACSYYIYCIVLYLAVDLPPEEQIPSMVRNRNMPAIKHDDIVIRNSKVAMCTCMCVCLHACV